MTSETKEEVNDEIVEKGETENIKHAEGLLANLPRHAIPFQQGCIDYRDLKGQVHLHLPRSLAPALITAAQNGHKEVIDALLAKGANIEAAINDGRTGEMAGV
ncbi:unnamed protein product [Chrysoparadoxa australica]